jgi:hypothetical protein
VISRGKFDNDTTTALKNMINDLKSRGKHVKLTPSDLACWIICYFENDQFKRKKDLLYYTFSDDNLYASELIKSKKPIKEIELNLKEFRKNKQELLKKPRNPLKKHGLITQLQTSTSKQRKVEFE